ncbi:RNA-guided endonuclease InsQ/TnpB family protein [Actinoallomurus rhizosphaericola]|uniref:RNA-guided endonuclease InsQ/TnpB family protein n=1 Tax=Actinoallomurus rhizosphaericola TaxID=2952536 RepID=UPI0020925EDD|nr:RNA-guided endonuclease TnpB family protein [Actinoallomurus rhizosphaericola]MCO5998348.1 RNA-guided endonuclease TnpB family protein [Actinoallomurus rhizosphaericola]
MRFRLTPTPTQEQGLLDHCAHARFVWNLAVEQHQHWQPGRASAPGYVEQCRQLTEARRAFEWLAAGSQTVQQQALRDFTQAMANFFAGTHRRPTWRKAGVHEGFRIVGQRGRQWDARRLSHKTGQVWIPKVGWVKFRWSRQVPDEAKSFRVNRDRAGRWHVCFAVIPTPIDGPGTGEVVGVDRGVVVSAALSTGEQWSVPGLRKTEADNLRRLQRRLARAKPGSNRRARVKMAIGRIKARETDRRKDWVEQTSTALARSYDVIRVEDLRIKNMVRSARGTLAAPGTNVRAKAGLNRSIHAAGWGLLVTRLEQKASGRVEKINPAYTSQICHACGHRAAESRESQAVFRCRTCGHVDDADVNAAKNIAAGRAVTARGALQPLGGAVNREPQPVLTSVETGLESPALTPGGGGRQFVPSLVAGSGVSPAI